MIRYCNLNSKATLLIEEIPYVKSVAMGFYIKVGSRHEPINMAGASHFIEHMLFKGTKNRTAKDIAESFEGIGGQLNAFTAKEYTCVYARTLDENVFEALDILLDMIFNSSFEDKDFNTEKGVVIEEINMYEDSPDELIHDIFAQKLWEGNSMGWPILGTIESVSAFTRNDIYEFYKQNYTPSNLIISIAGNVNTAEIKEKIEDYLNNKQEQIVNINNTEVDTKSPFISLTVKDTEQVQICIGGPSITYFDSNRYTQTVMNSILGGGLSSRLFQKIREELGLAYSVYSYPSSYSDTGSYTIYVGTSKNNIPRFFEALRQELDLFINRGVSIDEVNRAQKLMKSTIYLGMESTTNRMSRIGKSMLMYGKVITVEEVIKKIMAVTPEDVTSLASKVFAPNSLSIAAIGSDDILPIVEKEFKSHFK